MEVCKAVNVKHPENLLMAVKMMASNPPDVYFISKEGFQISTHRSILCLLSPYLSQIFSEIPGWINPTIQLPDVSASTINNLLKLVYTCFSTVDDVKDTLSKEADSVDDVAEMLGFKIQLKAEMKCDVMRYNKNKSNTNDEQSNISSDVNRNQTDIFPPKDDDKNESDDNLEMDISNNTEINENEDAKDYDTTFYSIEESDETFTDSDIADTSDSNVTYEMTDIEDDINETTVNLNKDDLDGAAENLITKDTLKTKVETIQEVGDKSQDINKAEQPSVNVKEETSENTNSEDNHESNESCQLCSETLLNKDLDEVMEHYFIHLEASLEESCGYLLSQDGKCKVCLKYVTGANGDRTVGLRHLGVDHDKLFFIFEKNGIIINEDMFSIVEESVEHGESSESVEIENIKDDGTFLEQIKIVEQLEVKIEDIVHPMDQMMEDYISHLEQIKEDAILSMKQHQDIQQSKLLNHDTAKTKDNMAEEDSESAHNSNHQETEADTEKEDANHGDNMDSERDYNSDLQVTEATTEKEDANDGDKIDTETDHNSDLQKTEANTEKEDINDEDKLDTEGTLNTGLQETEENTEGDDINGKDKLDTERANTDLQETESNTENEDINDGDKLDTESTLNNDLQETGANAEKEDINDEDKLDTKRTYTDLQETEENMVEDVNDESKDSFSENMSIIVNIEHNYSSSKRKRPESSDEESDGEIEKAIFNKRQRFEEENPPPLHAPGQHPGINLVSSKHLIGSILEDLMRTITGNYGHLESMNMSEETIDTNIESMNMSEETIDTNIESMNMPEETIDTNIESMNMSEETIDTNIESMNMSEEAIDTNIESIKLNNQVDCYNIDQENEIIGEEESQNENYSEEDDVDMKEQMWDNENEKQPNTDFHGQKSDVHFFEENNETDEIFDIKEPQKEENENTEEGEFDGNFGNDQQKESIINYFKENEINGDSEFDSDSDSDNEIEEIDDKFTPTELTTYTKSKMNGFPRPVAAHMLENEYNLIYILGDGHCLFRSLAHSMGYTPEMNMHLQIRQQIAMEGLRRIRFYYKLSNYYLSTPNSLPAFEAYLKKILYGGATWGCNIDLAIASKLYQMDIYKLCYNSTSNKAYYSVFSAFDGELRAERFAIIHFDDGRKGGEHYSALERVGGNVRPKLQVSDSVQSWVEMPDGTGKWSRFGAEKKVVKPAVEVSVDISDDSDSETEEVENQIEIEDDDEDVLVEDEDDNEVEGFNDAGEDFNVEVHESDEQLLVENDDVDEEFYDFETGNFNEAHSSTDVIPEERQETEIVNEVDPSSTDLGFEEVQEDPVVNEVDNEVDEDEVVDQVDDEHDSTDEVPEEVQEEEIVNKVDGEIPLENVSEQNENEQFVTENSLENARNSQNIECFDEDMDDDDHDINGESGFETSDELVQKKSLIDEINELVSMEKNNDNSADLEDDQTDEMDTEDNSEDNDLHEDMKTKYLDNIISNENTFDEITSDEQTMVTDDCNIEDHKKPSCLDDAFIGPKIKLNVDKFEKLVQVFVSSPNLSSVEIEDVSRSLDLSVKDGRWAFLKLKHKIKNNDDPQDCSAVLDLLQRVKESNMPDNIFTF